MNILGGQLAELCSWPHASPPFALLAVKHIFTKDPSYLFLLVVVAAALPQWFGL